ncbi:MAG: chitobiase/beta-hexosaminidase C-terminal domain-containing protein [Treponema sp.]|nr:chitobiase/beta-hexosaminidase C-terminal domain-containing protein [Treponema sp.]
MLQKIRRGGYGKNVLALFAAIAACVCVALYVVGCKNPAGSEGQSENQKVENVTFSPAAGEINGGTTITLSTATSGADIYWSKDGALSAQNYSQMVSANTATFGNKVSPINSGEVTVYALAVKEGMITSDVTSAKYTVKPGTEKIEHVTFAPADNKPIYAHSKITLTTAEPGATIYYTIDGEEPTESSTKYTAPFELPKANTTFTVKAIAFKNGKSSVVTEATYTVKIEFVEYIDETTNYDVAGNIVEALSKIGTATTAVSVDVSVSGIVTMINTNSNYFIVQDKDASIEFYRISRPSGLKVGDYITATATKGMMYYGVPEITEISGTVVIDESKKSDKLYYRNLTGLTDFSGWRGLNLAGMKAVADTVSNAPDSVIKFNGAKTGTEEKAHFGYTDWHTGGYFRFNVVFEEDASVIMNNSSLKNIVEDVTFTPGSGKVAADTKVTLATITRDATIRYTLDGTLPTDSSPECSTPITITGAAGEEVTIKAIAYKNDYTPSHVATGEYTIKAVEPPLTGTFYGKNGMKYVPLTASDNYDFDGNIKTVIDSFVSSNSAVKDINQELTGIVTQWVDGRTWFIQDKNAGIEVFLANSGTNLKLGDKVRFTATEIKKYNKTLQITGISGGVSVEQANATDTLYYVSGSNGWDEQDHRIYGVKGTVASGVVNGEANKKIAFDDVLEETVFFGQIIENSANGVRMEYVVTANADGSLQKLSEVTFNPPDGASAPKGGIVTLSSAEGGTIYYTTNGDTPTTGSDKYTSGVTLPSSGATVTVKAIAVKNNMIDSDVSSASYTLTAAETLVRTVGFETDEGFTASNIYNNTEEVLIGNTGSQWATICGTVSINNKITGTQSMQLRYYTSKAVTPYAVTKFSTQNLQRIVFTAKVGDAATKLEVSYSEDGATWKGVKRIDLSPTASDYSYVFAVPADAYVKFSQISTIDKTPLIIDDVKFYIIR